MNKDDIQQTGKQTGDFIDIESVHGLMKQVKLFAYDIPRGYLLAYYP